MKTTGSLHGAELVESAKEYGYSTANGYYTLRTWKGTPEQIDNLLPTLVAAGYDYTVKEGPLFTVTAKTPQQTDREGNPQVEVPIPIFELVSQRVDKDLLESNCPYVMSVNPVALRTIAETIKNELPPSFLTSSYNGGMFFDQAEKTRAAEIYVHYINGVQNYSVYVPVLRKTYNASNKYVVNESTANINRIFSTQTLIATEQVPTTIQGILPSSGDSSTIVPNPYNLSINYVIPASYGWLKGCPQYQQVGLNLFQVTVEYEYNLWSNLLYGTLI